MEFHNFKNCCLILSLSGESKGAHPPPSFPWCVLFIKVNKLISFDKPNSLDIDSINQSKSIVTMGLGVNVIDFSNHSLGPPQA